MVKRIFRVELSAKSRDFEPAVIEAGVPLLDASGANDAALRPVLGRLAAMPVREGESVDFFVCGDDGGRLHDVEVEPATDADLRGKLKADMDALQERVAQVEPPALREALTRQLAGLTKLGPTARACQLFKYRDRNQLRLVWCWGYRRRDNEPAPPVLCTHGECELLFVRRSEGSRKCPACEREIEKKKKAAAKPGGKKSLGKWLVGGVALLALLAAGGYFGRDYLGLGNTNPPVGPGPVVTTQPTAAISPGTWKGPVGGRVVFSLGKPAEPMSGLVDDPRVMRLEPDGRTAIARAPGETVIHFYSGGKEYHVNVAVTPPQNPDKLVLKPAELTLGIGATARLAATGVYADGQEVDLTDAIDWPSVPGATVFSHRGLLEGLAAGQAEVRARYRANPDAPFVETSAKVQVKGIEYAALKLSLGSNTIRTGESTPVQVVFVDASGGEHSANQSSKVALAIEPDGAGYLENGTLYGRQAGPGKITATMGKLSGSVDFTVSPASEQPGESRFAVRPNDVQMAVGETIALEVSSKSNDEIRFDSSAPEVVAVVDGRLVARAAGSATVTARQGEQQATIAVASSAQEFKTLTLTPETLRLPASDEAALSAVATLADGRRIDVSPDALTIERLPTPAFVEVDPASLLVRGMRATEDAPQTLVVRKGDLRAAAKIEVVAAPIQVVLEPANVAVPLGQAARLQAWAVHGGSRRVELSPDQVQWKFSPPRVPGLRFDERQGLASAVPLADGERAETPLKVQAVFEGQASNEVQITSAPAQPGRLVLKVNGPVRVGQSGQFFLTLEGGSATTELSPDLAEFASSAEPVLAVDRRSGGFQALTVGTTTITAKHPAAAEPATLDVTVAGPDSLKITSGDLQAVTIQVGAELDNVKVWAVAEGSPPEDVTANSQLSLDPAPASPDEAVIAIVNGRIKALRPGQITVHAQSQGLKTMTGLNVTVSEAMLASLRVIPATIELAVGESVNLKAEGLVKVGDADQSVGDLTSLGELAWKAGDADILKVDGPTVTALKPGKTSVIVRKGDAFGTAEVVVSEKAEAQPLAVEPQRLRLRVGESRPIGDIKVTRGGADFTGQSEWASTRPEVATIDTERQLIVGVAPGVAELAVTYRDASAILAVEVVPRDEQAKGTVVIEPSSGTLAIGEVQSLRVYFVTESGDRIDRTASAVLAARPATILATRGNRIAGLAAGEATVVAALPDVEQPGRATFTVQSEQFDRLVVSPERIFVAVGTQSRYQVFGVNARGRRELTGSPKLSVTAGGAKPGAIALTGTGVVRGNLSGSAALQAALGNLSAQAEVLVTDEPLTEIRLVPPQATVAVGGRRGYLVTARYGRTSRTLSPRDGVELRVSDTSVASINELAAIGNSLGTTEVVAEYGGKRATAQLTVGNPRSTSGGGSRVASSGGGGGGGATGGGGGGRMRRSRSGRGSYGGEYPYGYGYGLGYANWGGYTVPFGGFVPTQPSLRFSPDSMTLQVGAPETPLHLIATRADGVSSDVAHLAQIRVVQGGNAVEVVRSAAGPGLKGLRVGAARLVATYANFNSSPLLVQVVDQPDDGRLVVSPNPVHLTVGEQRELRVQWYPGAGQTPVDVDFHVDATGDVVAADGRSVRGLAAGNARVNVVADNLDARIRNRADNIAVQVRTGASRVFENVPGTETVDQPAQRTGLVLSGPSQTNVGAVASYRVELFNEAGSSDVTNDSAALVVDRDQAHLVEVRPGCVLAAKAPGAVNVRARLGGLVSNAIRLRIDGRAERYESLVLEIDRRPLTVGEARDFRLLATPAGGGAAQDLTQLIGNDAGQPRVIIRSTAPAADAAVASLAPPRVVGRGAGSFALAAAVGGLRSEVVNLDVVEIAAERVAITARPGAMVVRVGETTPVINVLASRPRVGEHAVEATLESLNPDVLAPSPTPGRFVGRARGSTKVRATFAGAEALIDVTVGGNAFKRVGTVGDPIKIGDREFQVEIAVAGDPPPTGGRQYRVVLPSGAGTSDWTPANVLEGEARVQMRTPNMRLGPDDMLYRLDVEARDDAGLVERYPFSFQLKRTIQQQ